MPSPRIYLLCECLVLWFYLRLPVPAMGLNVAAPHIIRFITVLETKSRAVTASSAADGFDDSLLQAGFQLPRPEHGATPQRTRLTAPTLTGIPGPSPLLGPPLSLRSSSSLPLSPRSAGLRSTGMAALSRAPLPPGAPEQPHLEEPEEPGSAGPTEPQGREGGRRCQAGCCAGMPALL